MTGPGLLTLGHGYSAARLTASLGPDWSSAGTVRDPKKAAALAATGVTPLDWDDAGAVSAAVGTASHLLISMPPDDAGDPALRRYGGVIAAARHLRWVGYLSTTGVYGDRQGGWVDEDSDLSPVGERGQRRLSAERAWLATALPVNVFRLAGIYGPGRSALDRVRAGRARRIVKPGQIFSRIHVDDIAQILAASMMAPDPGRAYNVADDVPAPPQDVIAFAAELLGVPAPPETAFETAELSPMARSFFSESKRVSNRRIKEALGVRLWFPDYRTGLRSILEAGG